MPLVSVITPAWNAQAFLAETIRSVQTQTVSDWEMLIADDCSTDQTCQLVEEFSKTDRRVKLIRRSVNGGPALTRQSALERASGRYVAFLYSDDLSLPTKLERQLAFMAEQPTALSYTAFRRISENGDRVGRLMQIPASLSHGQLLRNTAIATLTAMVDRQVAGDIHMTDEDYDDFCLWLGILKRGHIARGLQEDLARYRVVGNSVSSRPLRSGGWVWHIYRNVEKLSLAQSAWCLVNFAVRAYAKRLRF